MQKTRKQFDGEQEKSIDRLPDDILVHILSFVSSTRDCVRSSILGKRWRLLWSRVPNLKFDSSEHKTMRSLSNFLYRFVFKHKGQNINTFRFELFDSNHVDEEGKLEIETLIAAAIGCNAKVIGIQSGFELVFPECLFTSKTLVDLEINYIPQNMFFIPMVPMTGITVYLPALKKLQLGRIRYESEESLGHLLSGCPALEELTILLGLDKAVFFCVSKPTLTRLDLETDFEIGDDTMVNEAFDVKLDTPALKYLKLHISVSQDFSTRMLESLTEADILFYDVSGDFDHIICSNSVLEFVDKLNNVSCLKLSTGWLKFHDCGLTTEFRNLTKLEYRGDWRLVTKILENSDNLKVLSFFSRIVDLRDWMEPRQVPLCVKYHLGTVRFDEFRCTETEFKMVEYFLRNARVLKRMEIYFPFLVRDPNVDDLKEKYESLKEKYEALKKRHEALQRISSMFERASKACQVVFH